jgi:hypothetical protein
LETQLVIANKIDYVSNEELDLFLCRCDIVRKMIKSLVAKVIA